MVDHSDVRVLAKAPSNIALIKYMGKNDSLLNVPANGSLSMTLNSLCTFAEVTRQEAKSDSTVWIPEVPRLSSGMVRSAHEPRVPMLSESGQARVIRHVERVRAAIGEILAGHGAKHGVTASAKGELRIRAANTFPAAAGIASSASSFAAITLAVAAACSSDQKKFQRAFDTEIELRRALARVSRQGSGSSCRSFEGPWVLWQGESAAALRVPPSMPELVDFVVIAGAHPKEVSSSDAHQLVRTSPLWDGRTDRVATRLNTLEAALGEGDLATLARVSWAEMWEMHSLFHTCAEPFTYWEPSTVEVLKWVGSLLKSGETAPIVTMDAGPNIHIMVPLSEALAWKKRIAENVPGLEVLEDSQSKGAEIIEFSS